MKVTLTDRSGKVLFENLNYSSASKYQVSREVTSFFEEETPALQRMSQDFARSGKVTSWRLLMPGRSFAPAEKFTAEVAGGKCVQPMC